MKVLIILSSIVLVAFAKPRLPLPKVGISNGRIIGGVEAPPHAFPWQVSFRTLGQHICGGSIINENQVLSAAHCVEGQLALFDSVVAGAHKLTLESGHQKRNIKKLEGHENFNMNNLIDDISLITVSSPFDLSDPNVKAIETFKKDDAPIPVGTTCNSTGWGLTVGGGFAPPNALQWVQIDIVAQEECQKVFGNEVEIGAGMICAGKPGSAPCNGDSGGPLVCPDENGNGKLAGVVSFGVVNCKDLGVYTRVSNYEDWISERIL